MRLSGQVEPLAYPRPQSAPRFSGCFDFGLFGGPPKVSSVPASDEINLTSTNGASSVQRESQTVAPNTFQNFCKAQRMLAEKGKEYLSKTKDRTGIPAPRVVLTLPGHEGFMDRINLDALKDPHPILGPGKNNESAVVHFWFAGQACKVGFNVYQNRMEIVDVNGSSMIGVSNDRLRALKQALDSFLSDLVQDNGSHLLFQGPETDYRQWNNLNSIIYPDVSNIPGLGVLPPTPEAHHYARPGIMDA